MKCFMLFLFLTTSFLTGQSIAQKKHISKRDISGKWKSVLATSEGYRLEAPNDKSEIIISNKTIIFAYQYEKYDTLFIKNIRQINASILLMDISSPVLKFTQLKLFCLDKSKDILSFELDDQTSSHSPGLKLLICRNTKNLLLASNPYSDTTRR